MFDKRSKCCRKIASLPIWILLRMVVDKFSAIMPPVPRSNIAECSILGTPTLINEFCLPTYDDIMKEWIYQRNVLIRDENRREPSRGEILSILSKKILAICFDSRRFYQTCKRYVE